MIAAYGSVAPKQAEAPKPEEDVRALRLLLQHKDVEIRGLRKAVQQIPAARLAWACREVAGTPRRGCQCQDTSHQCLRAEVDRLAAELRTQKETYTQKVQFLEEKLQKMEALVLQLRKDVERLEQSQAECFHQESWQAKVPAVNLPPDSESGGSQESFELWSEAENKNSIPGLSVMSLQRVPKHVSLLDAFSKEGDTAPLRMEKEEPEEIQTLLSPHLAASTDLRKSWKNNELGKLSSAQKMDKFPGKKRQSTDSSQCRKPPLKLDQLSDQDECRDTVLFQDFPDTPGSTWPAGSGSPRPKIATELPRRSQMTHVFLSSTEGCGPASPSMASRRCSREESERPSNATNFLKIVTVDPNGHFIRILNCCSYVTMDISGYVIQQWVGKFPLSIYRFPADTTLPPRHHVTVWAAGTNLAEEDAKLKASQYFRAGPECTTILRDCQGRILSEFKAPHRRTAAADAYSDNTDLSVDKFPLDQETDQRAAAEPPPGQSTGIPAAVSKTSQRRSSSDCPASKPAHSDQPKGGKRKTKVKPKNMPSSSVRFSPEHLSCAAAKGSISSSSSNEHKFVPSAKQPVSTKLSARSCSHPDEWLSEGRDSSHRHMVTEEGQPVSGCSST